MSGGNLTRISLDWNCVIEVEENQSQASHVLDLVGAHRDGEFEVALFAASASENTKSKQFPGNASIFKKRVAQLGWSDLPLVPMPSISGLSYIGLCFIVGDGEAFERDRDAPWEIIAPNIHRKAADHIAAGKTFDDRAIQSPELSKWRNTWCDVISAYSHIHVGRDIFVTSNTRDFQKNESALKALGMKHNCTPANTRQMVEALTEV